MATGWQCRGVGGLGKSNLGATLGVKPAWSVDSWKNERRVPVGQECGQVFCGALIKQDAGNGTGCGLQRTF